MADEPIQQILEEMRTRIQAELDARVESLRAHDVEVVARARHEADAEADARWAPKLEAVQTEWAARLESELSSVRAEAEQRLVAETTRLRIELDQAVAAERERVSAEAAAQSVARVEEERARAAAEIEAERQQATAVLNTERHRLEQELEQIRAAFEEERTRLERDLQSQRETYTQREAQFQREAEAQRQAHAEREAQLLREGEVQREAHAEREAQFQRAAEAQRQAHAEREAQLLREGEVQREAHAEREAQLQREAEALREAQVSQPAAAGLASLLPATRLVDSARSLSETLTALVRGALQHAPRAAVFVLNGTRLDEWPAPGLERLSAGSVERDLSGLIRAAIERGSRAMAPDDGSAPSFAQLPDGRTAAAVPLTIGGQIVAVVYADQGAAPGQDEWNGWADGVELLARHAAARLAELTAERSLQWLGGRNGGASPEPQDEDQSARRYAKLLVSEIKLYNEGAVRVGRERRDLLQRLKAEIDRARRLYDERVSSTVPGRSAYFQQELVQTLAGGDASLLGS